MTQLDEASLIIGQLQASQTATAKDVTELKGQAGEMNKKLDRLLARSDKAKLSLKHWGAILAAGSFGGGGISHMLRKLLE